MNNVDFAKFKLIFIFGFEIEKLLKYNYECPYILKFYETIANTFKLKDVFLPK
jgi:hypothetical protein